MATSRRKRRAMRAVSDDELLARYGHLLEGLPHSAIARAHTVAFGELSDDQRTALIEQVRPVLPDAQRDVDAEDIGALAALAGEPDLREAMMRTTTAPVVAFEFIMSAPVAAYFSTGAGAMVVEREPPWVQELAGFEPNPIDGGTMHHRRGADSGHWIG